MLPGDRYYVVAVFACLAAKRLSVLPDATFPDARNLAIAASTGVEVVLTTRARAAEWDWPNVQPIIADLVYQGPEPDGYLDNDAPAFILCTSGSSGQPKPIVHSQRTMLHWARTTHDALHVTDRDRALSLSSLPSLGGFTALLSYPLAGASMQLLDLKAAGLAGLMQALRDAPITILRAAPSLLRMAAALDDARAVFSGLRIVQTYGEPLTMADVRLLRAVLGSGAASADGFCGGECRIRAYELATMALVVTGCAGDAFAGAALRHLSW